jgi:hypothetical protein
LKCKKLKEITKEGSVLKLVSLFMLEVLESRNLPKEATCSMLIAKIS